MERFDLNRDWKLSRPGGIFDSFGGAQAGSIVDLPHDAQIVERRRRDSINGPDGAWYNGGTYIYEKTIQVPREWKGSCLLVEFEAVAQNAMVFVDDQFAGKCPCAYSDFKVDISALVNYGGESTIKVLAKTGMGHTSRWYVGSGILRPVWLWKGQELYLVPDGVRFTTESCNAEEANVRCEISLRHTELSRRRCRVKTTLTDTQGNVVAQEIQPVTLFGADTTTLRTRFHLEQPQLWDLDTPNLYDLTVTLLDGETQLDQTTVKVGIRTVSVDHANGFRLNGKTIKLRGGAMHHDNGILGGITLPEAELRRVKKLKAAGFNAIRSAHNPASKALLDACDQEGMLMMDELFDCWNESKRDHDYSLYFTEWWEKDMESLVAKDYNHPSVVIYTMGNEIPETGSAAGAAQSRAMLEKFHQLDQSRPIANCINGMFSVMPQMRTILAEVLDSQVGELPTDINELMSMFDANIGEIMKHPIVANATEETFAGVDVCGYNYMASRYEPDGTLYPNRVIVGSETNPDQIGYNWPVVSKLPYVIGDFCWTAWEYIGEAGVGKNDYDMTHAMYGPWPWFLAYCGDFDLCGNRRPQSFYREIVFGQRKQPYVCAERPEHYGQEKCVTNWTWPDVVESWTWPGFEGKHTHVEVYSDAQEVELILNGTSLGSQTVGETMPYKAIFDVEYQPGTLVAVAKNQGQEVSRMELTTCGKETGVSLTPEKDTIPADGMALTYINVELVDDTGALVPAAQADVTIQVEGPGVVAGFGSANPATEELFNSDTHSTFDGRALVILRATEEAGTVTITATAPGLKEGRAVVHIQ